MLTWSNIMLVKYYFCQNSIVDNGESWKFDSAVRKLMQWHGSCAEIVAWRWYYHLSVVTYGLSAATTGQLNFCSG